MKTLLILTLILSGSALAQTNIIAAKSHASSRVNDKNDTDNFGLPDEFRTIKKVEYFKDDCIIEISEVTMFETRIEMDTICDHPFLKKGSFDIERIKSMYPEGTKFSGFDQLNRTSKKAIRKSRRENRSKKSIGILLFLIGSTTLLTYLFIPKTSLSRS